MTEWQEDLAKAKRRDKRRRLAESFGRSAGRSIVWIPFVTWLAMLTAGNFGFPEIGYEECIPLGGLLYFLFAPDADE